jgi:methyl-accepting chemotaxis protein
MSSTSIQTRLIVIVVLFAVGIAALAALASARMQDRILTERKAATRSVVQTALGVLTYYGQEEEAGRLTEKQAQTAALAAVEQLRYSGTEYFWINDMTPTMVMHPVKPELDGTDLSTSEDPDGKRLFVDMVKVVQDKGAGFVEYQWPKPGSEAPQPKVSYVAGYEPWGWLIGSGVYVDDVRSVAWGETVALLLSGLLVLAVVGAAALFIGRTIVRPIRSATDLLASGDLTTRLPEGGRHNELEKLAVALNGTLDRSAEVATNVSDAARQLDAAVTSLVETSDGITESAERTAEQTATASSSAHEVSSGIESVAAGTKQMGASINEIAQNTSSLARIAGEAVEIADSTNHVVAALGDSSAEIGNVVKVITAIAEQTNLLALNATIDAARAGSATSRTPSPVPSRSRPPPPRRSRAASPTPPTAAATSPRPWSWSTTPPERPGPSWRASGPPPTTWPPPPGGCRRPSADPEADAAGSRLVWGERRPGRVPVGSRWGGWGSNPRPKDYESSALTG